MKSRLQRPDDNCARRGRKFSIFKIRFFFFCGPWPYTTVHSGNLRGGWYHR